MKIEIDKPETFRKIISKVLYSRHSHLINPKLRGSESADTIIDDVTTTVWMKLNQLRGKDVEIKSLSAIIYVMANFSLTDILVSLIGRRYEGREGHRSTISDDLPLNFESINPVGCNGLATVELSQVLDELSDQVDGDLYLDSILNTGTRKEQFADKGVGERDGYFRLDRLRLKMNQLRLNGVI